MTRNRISIPSLPSLFVATIAFIASAAGAQARSKADPPPVQIESIREWIARYHASIYSGDPHVNAVLIVVDANSQYVASVADSLSPATTAAIDSGFADVAAHNDAQPMAEALAAGRLTVPGGDGKRPVYVVDGARKPNVDSLNPNSIVGIRLITPADAVSAYGADASGGAIAVTTWRPESPALVASRRERLRKLGITPERLDNDRMEMHVRGGAIGPNPLYIMVLRLKGSAF